MADTFIAHRWQGRLLPDRVSVPRQRLSDSMRSRWMAVQEDA